MPAQQRIRRDDRAQIKENLAWNAEGFARQQRTLLVREAQRTSVKPCAQHAVLSFQVFNNDELLSADPAGEQEQDESDWRRSQIHAQSLARCARSCLKYQSERVDRIFGHYANRLEIEAKVPYVYRQDSTTARALLQQSFNDEVFNAQGSGLGDAEFTARYQLNKGGTDSAYYVGALRFKTTTGKGPFDVPTVSPVPGVFVQSQLPTGTGFYALQPSIIALYPSDPAVFFGGASYIWNIKRHVSSAIGDYDPGDGFTFNFGMGLALNERASFSVGYEHDVFFKDKQNGQYVVNAQTEHLGTLLVGYSYRISKRVSFNLTLGAGLTPDAPDVTITARFPITF
jgi:hypothetical protein